MSAWEVSSSSSWGKYMDGDLVFGISVIVFQCTYKAAKIIYVDRIARDRTVPNAGGFATAAVNVIKKHIDHLNRKSSCSFLVTQSANNT